jgi:hypothetical protein
MKKIFYLAIGIITIGSASSCSKQCVQCTATDRLGVTVNTSSVICDGPENRKHFEKRYEAQFSGYNAVCVNVND